MKVCLVHNYYQHRGGEEAVVAAELALLRRAGLEVCLYSVDSQLISTARDKLKTAVHLRYATEQRRSFGAYLRRQGPDLVHVHNTFPLLTPAVFDACIDHAIPSLYTLHNYRIVCPTATLSHNGRVDERSLAHSCYWTVPHRVYRDSYLATLALAHAVEHHKRAGTWRNKVDRFIALSQFAKDKFIQAGLPPDKISVKTNFIEDPASDGCTASRSAKDYALFVGRLSPEKGIQTLLAAWRDIDFPLVIVGDGPLAPLPQGLPATIRYLGQQDRPTINALMRDARFLVMPSTWYEGCPMVLLEALAHGLPVLCSRLGSLRELVADRVEGLHFTPGDRDDLNRRARYLIDSPAACGEYGDRARAAYLRRHTPRANAAQLLALYSALLPGGPMADSARHGGSAGLPA